MKWLVYSVLCDDLNTVATLTTISVYFIKRVMWKRQHAHVWPELLDERVQHILCGGRTRHSDTLGRNLRARVLEEEAHDAIEVELLQYTK